PFLRRRLGIGEDSKAGGMALQRARRVAHVAAADRLALGSGANGKAAARRLGVAEPVAGHGFGRDHIFGAVADPGDADGGMNAESFHGTISCSYFVVAAGIVGPNSARLTCWPQCY